MIKVFLRLFSLIFISITWCVHLVMHFNSEAVINHEPILWILSISFVFLLFSLFD